jgi:hypothetical protein
MPLLVKLHSESKHSILVKYRLQNRRGEVEHPWGELQHIDATAFRATLLTPLVGGNPQDPPFELPLSSLEDWQLELPDGAIRGGFTVRAEIEFSRRAGKSLPSHIAAMEGRFVDA